MYLDLPLASAKFSRNPLASPIYKKKKKVRIKPREKRGKRLSRTEKKRECNLCRRRNRGLSWFQNLGLEREWKRKKRKE